MRVRPTRLRTIRPVGSASTETSSLSGAPSEETDGGPAIGRSVLVAVVCTWAVVVVFGVVTLLWSRHVGVGLRDPGGRLFSHKLAGALVLFLILAALDVLIRTARAGWSWGQLRTQFADRWGVRRLALILSTLLAYHLVYICYRNLKSWTALRTPRDHDLAAVDRWIFLGHSPASVLHDLLGQSHAMAAALAQVYDSFAQVLSVAVVAAPVFITSTRRGLVMLTAGMWAWILGTISYYAVPSLGPIFTAAADFAGLPHTAIPDHAATYMQQRHDFLANPSDPSGFVSISAFASLHVGLTCMMVLMAVYYRKRLLTALLAVYLVAVMVSTVYFGWHFFVDVVAGVVLAFASVGLGRLTVYPDRLLRRRRASR